MTTQLTPYQQIDGYLRTKEITGKMKLALGNDEDAFKYIAGVLNEIQKSMGDPKKDLSTCTPDSIGRAIIDAASFKLPIDGRGYAHLIKYGNTANFQVGYKGLIAKISEVYGNVNFTAEIVFKDDVVTVADDNGYQRYTLSKANPFENNQANMKGVIACLSYEQGGNKYQKVVAMPKAEIDQIRKTAKQDFIWSAWYFEKAKAAALKRLCKINFATVMGLQDLIAYDNEENHIMPTPPVANDINKIIEQDIGQGMVDVTPKEEVVEPLQPKQIPVKKMPDDVTKQDWDNWVEQWEVMVAGMTDEQSLNKLRKLNEAILAILEKANPPKFNYVMETFTNRMVEVDGVRDVA